MTLLTSFGAVHYRGIDGLSLPRLSHANLVTGVNGIGKTALLEAIWLFTGRYNPMLLWNANVQRSTNPVLESCREIVRRQAGAPWSGERSESPTDVSSSRRSPTSRGLQQTEMLWNRTWRSFR